MYRDETSAFLGSVFKLRFHVLISCLLFFLIADRVPQYYSLTDNKPTSFIYIYTYIYIRATFDSYCLYEKQERGKNRGGIYRTNYYFEISIEKRLYKFF